MLQYLEEFVFLLFPQNKDMSVVDEDLAPDLTQFNFR